MQRFFGLLKPFRWQVGWILFSLTVATVLALIPPAGTKFVVDYVLTDHPLPDSIASGIPAFTDRKTLLMVTVLAVVAVSLCKIIVHIWGRWYATRMTKRIQLDVRRRVFEHAVRLPLHRVQEIRSGGVASILREDGGSVGELVFGLLYNPWRAIIQLIGSLLILAWVDWTLLLGALILLTLVYFSHHTWIARIRPQFRAIRRQREFIDAGAAEAFAGMRIVRAFSRQRREAGRFILENNLMARKELFAWWWMRSVEMVWEAMIPLTSAALMFYGGWKVIDGSLTVGDLMMFLVYLLMLLQPLAILAQSATQFQNSLSGLDRILDLLDELGIADNTIVFYSTDNGPHYNTWPDAASTPFRGEKNTNWEGGWRVPAMVRWPGNIPAGSVTNEIVHHMDWLPTFAAAAGKADVKEDLLDGWSSSALGRSYKVHLDGYDILPLLTGETDVSPREEIFYFSDDGDLTALRWNDWKLIFMEQKAEGTFRVWMEPFVPLRIPLMFNLRRDPFERAETTSNTYFDWVLDHVFFMVPAQTYVGRFLATFQEYPPRQKAASFSLDQVMEKLAPPTN